MKTSKNMPSSREQAPSHLWQARFTTRAALSTGCLSLFLMLGCASSSEVEPVEARGPKAIEPSIERLLATGRFEKGELWRLNLSHATTRPCVDRRIEVHEDLVLVQDNDHMVRALDKEHGVHRWVVDFGLPLSQEIGVSENSVTVVGGDDLVSVHRDSGARLIERPLLHLNFWPSCDGVAAGGTVFVGRDAPYGIQSLDPKTGVGGWHYPTSSPVLDLITHGTGGAIQVIAMTNDGTLLALAPWHAALPRPARANWTTELRGTHLTGGLTISGDNLLFAAEDGFFHCIDARSGLVRWKTPCECELAPARPVAAGGDVYCAAEGRLIALDQQSGAIRWSCENGKRLISRIGSQCYVALAGTAVAVHDAQSGKEVARFSIEGLTHVPSIPEGGIFLAGDGGGNLFALR